MSGIETFAEGGGCPPFSGAVIHGKCDVPTNSYLFQLGRSEFSGGIGDCVCYSNFCMVKIGLDSPFGGWVGPPVRRQTKGSVNDSYVPKDSAAARCR